MLTPTHRVAKCAAVAAMKQYKNSHQASGAGDGRGNASGVQVSDGVIRTPVSSSGVSCGGFWYCMRCPK